VLHIYIYIYIYIYDISSLRVKYSNFSGRSGLLCSPYIRNYKFSARNSVPLCVCVCVHACAVYRKINHLKY